MRIIEFSASGFFRGKLIQEFFHALGTNMWSWISNMLIPGWRFHKKINTPWNFYLHKGQYLLVLKYFGKSYWQEQKSSSTTEHSNIYLLKYLGKSYRHEQKWNSTTEHSNIYLLKYLGKSYRQEQKSSSTIEHSKEKSTKTSAKTRLDFQVILYNQKYSSLLVIS